MHTKGEYINGISETTVVGELALDLGMIDPKVDLARIRLAVGDAPMAVDPQMESASLLGIVATDQIAQRIPKIVVDLCPQGDRKRPAIPWRPLATTLRWWDGSAARRCSDQVDQIKN